MRPGAHSNREPDRQPTVGSLVRLVGKRTPSEGGPVRTRKIWFAECYGFTRMVSDFGGQGRGVVLGEVKGDLQRGFDAGHYGFIELP